MIVFVIVYFFRKINI